MMTYLDYNSTTPIAPRIFDVMQPWMQHQFGNPSNRDHEWGWNASEAVEEARQALAEFVNSSSKEINFSSGATESINTVIKGFVGYGHYDRKKIITCATEHEAVLAPARQLKRLTEIDVDVLPVDHLGNINLGHLETALSSGKETLVALMAANNEIGTIHHVRAICDLIKEAGALFLCDITQAVGKIPIDVRADGIDYAAFSAHKMYGPKGVGALFVRSGIPNVELEPLITGGGQEHGLRGGTLNVPGIAGFGEACRLASSVMEEETKRIRELRDKLEEAILSEVPDTWINGDRTNRLCNTSNIGFRGVDGRTLIRDMHDIACSTRSACSGGAPGPSHVLKAIGLTDSEAYSCIRLSLGRFTTDEEIDYAIHKVVKSVHKLRRQKM